MTIGSGLFLHPAEKDQTRINSVIRQLIEGRSNGVGTFTLTSSAGSTTVTSPIIGPNSVVVWQPATAHAAAQMTVMYVSSIGAGTMTLTHGSNANADQTFKFAAIG